MSVENEIQEQELVAAFKTFYSQKINVNISVNDINAGSRAIKEMPLYDSMTTEEEKADIDNVIDKTTDFHL